MKPPGEWPPPPEIAAIPLSADDAQFLEARQYQKDQITREVGIPWNLMHDAPDNPRRVFRGFDLARDMDFAAWLFWGPSREAVTAAIRSSSEAFAAMGRAIADANLKFYEADRAFLIVWWHLLTPAQRRRAGKRLIREEIARRRIAKIGGGCE